MIQGGKNWNLFKQELKFHSKSFRSRRDCSPISKNEAKNDGCKLFCLIVHEIIGYNYNCVPISRARENSDLIAGLWHIFPSVSLRAFPHLLIGREFPSHDVASCCQFILSRTDKQ